MIFSSLFFIGIFLPVLVMVYYLPWKKLRNPVLFAGSLVFYAWGGMDFIQFLLAVIVVHWGAGLWVKHLREKERLKAKLVVGATIVADLCLIGWFKYSNFVVDQLNAASLALGDGALIDAWKPVVLPIGISFFTFQAISYILDVMSGRVQALKNPISFGLYISMFPQLIAGPIVRYSEIEDELESDRKINYEVFCSGLIRFAHGFVKKVLVADQVSLFADAVFSAPQQASTLECWIGALAYTIQIYFDFSAYSDMAIGLGRVFGFHIPENFNRPYSSHSITEFWRRWHMTLSRWFRDYLYIPLGGNRRGTARTYANLIIVFLAVAVWHGANWTFLVWGMWHGLFLVFERTRIGAVRSQSYLNRFRTILLVIIGWVFFRANSVGEGWMVVKGMFGFGEGWLGIANIASHLWLQPVAAFLFGCCLMFLGGGAPVGRMLPGAESNLWVRMLKPVLPFLFAAAVLLLVVGSNSPFLYFRF